MNENETLDLLDETLDDLADLPQQQPFAPGAYIAKVHVRANPKKAGSYVMEMIHQETVELANPESAEPTPGDKSVIFVTTIKKDGTKNDFGQGQLKMILKPMVELAGSSRIGDILEAIKDGVDCAVVVGIRKSKDEQYDDQQSLVKIELV